ncbi:MAG: SMC-Scp complex subunit ScpB [Planctomycetaceae bacterium]
MFFGRKPAAAEEEETPFQAVVQPQAAPQPDPAALLPETESSEAGWSVDEIEAAYMRALEAAESVDAPDFIPEVEVEDLATEETDLADVYVADETPSSAPDDDARADNATSTTTIDEAPRVTLRQIVEALLFVGGRPLTSRQLADVLGGSTTAEQVDDLVVDLNTEYSRQQRPYLVRLGEGGYRLDLHSEFDKVRARVFGIGPREVKLTQNALEALALVAYQQPISKAEVEDSGIHGASGLLRQLLRRELIVLQRGSDGEPDTYRTTPRFLELFGLRSLADLPRPEAVNLR